MNTSSKRLRKELQVKETDDMIVLGANKENIRDWRAVIKGLCLSIYLSIYLSVCLFLHRVVQFKAIYRRVISCLRLHTQVHLHRHLRAMSFSFVSMLVLNTDLYLHQSAS